MLAVAALVAWPFWQASQVWSDLRMTADAIPVSEELGLIEQVESGVGFCWVSCTGGGEATIAMLMDASSLDTTDACDRVESAVRSVAGQVDEEKQLPADWECGFYANGVGKQVVRGLVLRDPRSFCQVGCGFRWADSQPPPDVELLAVIEVFSGIE
jgi:hypothetical protein